MAHAGGRAPTVGALGNAGAVADDCMDAGGRAMQEQLPRGLQNQNFTRQLGLERQQAQLRALRSSNRNLQFFSD